MEENELRAFVRKELLNALENIVDNAARRAQSKDGEAMTYGDLRTAIWDEFSESL